MADNYIQITSENFTEKVLHASHLVIVNFSHELSSACQIQDPEFEAISKEYSDRILFAKLSLQGQNDLTQQWGVESVPTLIFIKSGQEVYRITGVVMRNKLRRQIEGLLLID
jgi:thioredoxin 1